MDLRSHVLSLLAPTTVGGELAPGVRLLGAGSELGLQLRFDVGGRRVHVDVEPAANVERPFAARSDALLFSYRSGAGSHAVDADTGVALCRTVAAAARANERRVLSAIAAAAVARRDARRVREVVVERLLEPWGMYC